VATDLMLRGNTEIQGDILAGFKKDQLCLLFLQFEDVARARAWLGDVLPSIATTKQVADFNAKFSNARKTSGGDDPETLKATWLGLSLTYPGIQFLTGLSSPIPQVVAGTTLEAFVDGAANRALALGDVDESAPRQWFFGSDIGRTIHAVLTIASDTATDLRNAIAAQREAVTRAGAVIVFQQDAAHFQGGRRGKEHFGFRDGVSEPGVAGFDEEDPNREGYVKGHPGTRLIPAGEFVIGHPRVVHGAPRNFPEQDIPPWMINSSFQVIRRLAQDVPGWWAQVARQLETLKNTKGAVPENATVEWLAARLVGRWCSGAPVYKYPASDPVHDPDAARDNDLSFVDDPDGHRTPLFSHLRKTAPRDGLVDGSGPVDEVFMDARRMIRRGSPYGQPFDPSAGGAYGPDAARGLLFVCYQADLVDQFEFIQSHWIDSPNFPPDRAPHAPGPDTMVSGRLDQINDGVVHYECPTDLGARLVTKLAFHRFVHTEGALYAIALSISTLRLLAQGRLDEQMPGVAGVDEILPMPDAGQLPGVSQFWLFRRDEVRPIAIPDGNDGTDGVRRPVTAIATWPALRGITQINAILPIPDMQGAGGKSYYWVFHTIGNEQVYRIISIANGAEYTDALVAQDRGLSLWPSLTGVSHVDAFLPIPDMQRTDGKSHYWVFHTTQDKQAYRVISIADGQLHTDTQERGDNQLTAWPSLTGVAKVTTFLGVPTMRNAAGKTHFWVFHGNRVRTISVAHDRGHTDTMVGDDRPLNVWDNVD
jgi:Dyp-type peroxidase family